MQLIETIINDLMDRQISLTNALSKTKVLATRINNEQLLKWVDLEMGGYNGKESVPVYRMIKGKLVADFINGYQQASNFPISLNLNNSKLQKKLDTAYFTDSIAHLESMAKGKTKMLKYEFTNDQRAIIEQALRNYNAPNFQLLSVGISLPVGAVYEILSTVHKRLLDFMLQLEKEFGLEAPINTLKSNNEIITNYMTTTINNTGDGNVINTGESSTIHANIQIAKGDKEKLKKDLAENYVQQEDIDDLTAIIDTEKVSAEGVFGEKVNGWIKTMLSKSLEGSWQIGIGAAGSVLATIIQHYYGVA